MTDIVQRARIRPLFCAEHGQRGRTSSEFDDAVAVPDRE
jgi:hypothetical protein